MNLNVAGPIWRIMIGVAAIIWAFIVIFGALLHIDISIGVVAVYVFIWGILFLFNR